jgi:hypothetical protein
VLADPRGTATGQDGGAYVSVSGTMRIVDDRMRVYALWKESWPAWFPTGKSDPDLVLMHLRLESGEYWSKRGAMGVRTLFEVAKALVAGKQPSGEYAAQHARLTLNTDSTAA